jgi:hypothetical protein
MKSEAFSTVGPCCGLVLGLVLSAIGLTQQSPFWRDPSRHEVRFVTAETLPLISPSNFSNEARTLIGK